MNFCITSSACCERMILEGGNRGRMSIVQRVVGLERCDQAGREGKEKVARTVLSATIFRDLGREEENASPPNNYACANTHAPCGGR